MSRDISKSKTEEKQEQQKAALESMRRATANMQQALERIDRLEHTLRVTANALDEAAKMLPGYKYNSVTPLRDYYLDVVSSAKKLL